MSLRFAKRNPPLRLSMSVTVSTSLPIVDFARAMRDPAP